MIRFIYALIIVSTFLVYNDQVFLSQYGCSRGVTGTPFFFVNGFPLPDAGSAIDYEGWRKIIDPLVGERDVKKEESLHFFL